jgi:hypothetical protein
MSHSTVTVVIREAGTATDAMERLADLLAPFDENRETDPYAEWLDDSQVQQAVGFYRENPEHCTTESGPTKPFDEYVTEGNLEAWRDWTRMAVGAYYSSGPEDGIYDTEGDRFGYWCSYNPKSRWDWWELGGRWHGFYQLKTQVALGSVPVPEWRKELAEKYSFKEKRVFGEQTVTEYDGSQDAVLGSSGVFGDDESENFEGRADLARKGHIDWEAMRALSGAHADQAYDAYEKAVVGLALPENWQETVRRVHFDMDEDPDATYDGYVLSCNAEQLTPVPPDEWHESRRRIIDEARRQYHEQPWIQALAKEDLLGFFGDPLEDWCVHSGGREAYVGHARDGAGITHAVLLDGEWHEQGRMGWFGVVSNEKDTSTWEHQFAQLIDSLPDEVYLAVVDVHI